MGGGGGKGGKGGSKQQITDYYLSMHWGESLGPVDSVNRLWVNEKEVVIAKVTENTAVTISNTGLFGGPKEGGGVEGTMHVLLGGEDQILPDVLAWRLDQKPGSQVPGFRKHFTMFFTGFDKKIPVGSVWSAAAMQAAVSKRGFMWGSNNPTVPPIWVEVTRAPKTLAGDDPMIGRDANPAHMIHECLTDKSFARGIDPQLLDTQSFLKSAATLRTEKLGLSMQWTGQSHIQDYITEIIDHINGVLSPNPRTGLLSLDLIRDDYSYDDLPIITVDNAKLSNFQRKTWGDTINEVNVTFTNPENEETETVTVHDLANIEIQGEIVNSAKNYWGVRNRDLAQKLADRDIQTLAAPLASCDVELNRKFWHLRTGQAVRLQWPENGIADAVFRLGIVDYGKPGEMRIQASLIQDIFAYESTQFTPPPTSWIDPQTAAENITHYRLDTVPYFVIAQVGGDEAASDLTYPTTYALLLSGQDKPDWKRSDFLYEAPDVTGRIGFPTGGSLENQSRGLLDSALNRETVSDLLVRERTGRKPENGFLILITSEDNEPVHEIAAIELIADDTGNTMRIRRGVLDTIPRAWPRDSIVWLIDPDSRLADFTERLAGEVPRYKFLPVTSYNQLLPNEADIHEITVTDRPHLPYRPANVRVNDQLWGPVVVRFAATFEVTWARRNRLLETAQALAWTEPDATPEVGQTVTVEVFRDGQIIASHAGLTGTSLVIDPTTYFNNSAGDLLTLRIYSVRDGLRSFETVIFDVQIATANTGWGRGWSISWGKV